MTKLTDVERLTLANQFLILNKLQPDEHYAHAAEALMRGYEGLYQQLVFEHLWEPTPARITEEVLDIFDMYRGLTNAYKHHGVKKPKGYHPEFEGFDGNHDPHHGVGTFMVDELGLWPELKGRPMNSHTSSTLPSYLKMVAVWRKLGKPHPISQAQADEIVAAG
jgi:uncharacterized protein YfbU (UPF0304 family)